MPGVEEFPAEGKRLEAGGLGFRQLAALTEDISLIGQGSGNFRMFVAMDLAEQSQRRIRQRLGLGLLAVQLNDG